MKWLYAGSPFPFYFSHLIPFHSHSLQRRLGQEREGITSIHFLSSEWYGLVK